MAARVGPAAASKPTAAPPTFSTSSANARRAVKMHAAQPHKEEAPTAGFQKAVRAAVALAAGVQLAVSPAAGPALAALDTSTKPAPDAGVAAKVEGSNLNNQSGRDALSQLANVLIPNTDAALNKLDNSEAKSARLELNQLAERAAKLDASWGNGMNDQELKASVTGIEQQLNAAKAIAGLD